jgi:hypothetical protein
MLHTSVVDMATGYGLEDWEALSSIPGKVKNLLLLHIVQTGYGAHPTTYPVGSGSTFSKG